MKPSHQIFKIQHHGLIDRENKTLKRYLFIFPALTLLLFAAFLSNVAMGAWQFRVAPTPTAYPRYGLMHAYLKTATVNSYEGGTSSTSSCIWRDISGSAYSCDLVPYDSNFTPTSSARGVEFRSSRGLLSPIGSQIGTQPRSIVFHIIRDIDYTYDIWLCDNIDAIFFKYAYPTNQVRSNDTTKGINSTNNKIPLGSWMTVVFVDDGVNSKVVVDGTTVTSGDLTTTSVCTTRRFQVGAYANSNYLCGAIDGLLWYNRALTSAEIASASTWF